MKNLTFKLLVAAGAVFALLLNPIFPASADSIIVASGFIHDPNGKPVSGVQVEVVSNDQNHSQRLDVLAASDSSGKFSFQTYSNYVLTINSGEKCIYGQYNQAKIPDSQKIDIQVPMERLIKINVKAKSGVPIPGVELDLMPMGFSGRFQCQLQRSIRTDESGNATFTSFVGGSVNPGSYPGDFAVKYAPFENVSLTKWVPSGSIVDNQMTSVTLDDVPYVEIHAPSVAKTSGFDAIAYVLNPDGLQATNSAMVKANSFRAAVSRAKFNKVALLKRTLVKGKWGVWITQSEVAVDANGVAKFTKLKFSKGTYQIRFSGLGFTLGSGTKTILVK